MTGLEVVVIEGTCGKKEEGGLKSGESQEE